MPLIPLRHTMSLRSSRCVAMALRLLQVAWLLALGNSVRAEVAVSAQSILDQELQRREAVLRGQAKVLQEADESLRRRDYKQAHQLFGNAYRALPDVDRARPLRAVAAEGLLRSGLLLSKELAAASKLTEARKLAASLDVEGIGLGDGQLRQWLITLDDPDSFAPALDAAHRQSYEKVVDLLSKANSSLELGKWDAANQLFEEVLLIDPTNVAARRGMEQVEGQRARYFRAATDQARALRLNEVTKAWQNDLPPKAGVTMAAAPDGAQSSSAQRRMSLASKLAKLRLPSIVFDQVSLQEALEFLKVRARDVDPERKGIDFVMALPAAQAAATLSLNLTDVPVEEVLRYATDLTGCGYRVEEFAVRIVPAGDTGKELITRTYRVPPGFLSNAAVSSAPAAAADPFAQGQGAQAASTSIARRMGAKEFLESRGVTIAEGGSATYIASTNTLTVRTDVKNIELVEALVEQVAGASPKMAMIDVKVVEVSGGNLDELGFDWLISSIAGQARIGAGTAGNQISNDFTTTEFPNLAGLTRSTLNPITAGLRSAANLDFNKTIESLLYGGGVNSNASRSPGFLSLAGVLTTPQFQLVIRGMKQKDGMDVVSKPSIIAKSGQKASVEIIREMIYPTEFDPPQIPTNIGGNQLFINGVLQPTIIPPIPVTPTTPTAFEMRRVGMILDVEPAITEDNKAVDLVLTPELTEFMGFVNYGTPIYTVSTAGFVRPVELTPNRIFQPIFSRRKITTAVKVHDGATVVLGGVISDQEIMIDDEIPILGKLPVIGRAFQSKVKQRKQKNMLMFVTVRIVDPSGRPVNQLAP